MQKTFFYVDDFPYSKFRNCSIIESKDKCYYNAIATFDIETTSIQKEWCSMFDKNFAFMYVWQFCIDGEVIIGRTWEEFLTFIQKLKEVQQNKYPKFVVWVHNLAFEFQFLRNFLEMEKVFAREPRKPINVITKDIEFRCSLALSNMNLDSFLKNGKNVKFQKMNGKDFDYSVIRYPDTELTNEELGYCISDVMGLYERMKEMLEEDTLISIPMTSTGYVRRDYRNAMAKNPRNHNILWRTKLDPMTYSKCYEAVRGGVSGSNASHTDFILNDVDSYDKVSSYPYQMAVKTFPMSRFIKYNAEYGTDKFEHLLDNFCCLITWEAKNFKQKRWSSIPYIAKDKCRAIAGGKFGNGKVYFADRIGMTCTEIDFRIIESHYNFDKESVVIHEIYCSEKGMLPYEFREHLLYMFQQKTDLKGGDQFLYNKFKNKINGSFGMMLTNILNDEISYTPKSEKIWTAVKVEDYASQLAKYYTNKNSFLAYQWGVWVTAHARDDLMVGIDGVGDDIVQTDTDSVKCLNGHEDLFEEINKGIIAKAESYDIKPYAIKDNKKIYLGVWEHEKHYHKFKTLGAKKYAYEDEEGKIYVTVAGLRPKGDKEKGTKGGADFIEEMGGLDAAFNTGQVFPPEYSGRTEATYCDINYPETIYLKGHKITLGSSIAIFPSEYTLGITGEWNSVITSKDPEDFFSKIR